MENKLDFEGLSRFLLLRINELLPSWLPGGKIVGHEYCCGNLSGSQGKSCKVNIRTGMWADFASDGRGGDLISLYAEIHKIGQGEASKQLKEQYSYMPSMGVSVSHETSPAVPQLVPPGGVPNPNFTHFKHGDPVKTWCYRSAEGNPLFYVARYDVEDGKEFIPFTWAGDRWQNKAWPENRPLYGLEQLAEYPKKPIILVEGEKACDAARKIVSPHYLVLTWSGGSKAFSKTDFSPIYGRNIVLWPDADEPGIIAMHKIASILHSHCPSIKTIKVIETQPV